jgi:hypothetical protein
MDEIIIVILLLFILGGGHKLYARGHQILNTGLYRNIILLQLIYLI